MIQQFANHLQSTISPDKSIRDAATAYLNSMELQPGFTLLLMQLMSAMQDHNDVCMAGAVFFKNFVKRYWVLVEQVYINTVIYYMHQLLVGVY